MMDRRFGTLLGIGALALLIGSSSILAAEKQEGQSKLPAAQALKTPSGSKDATTTSATAATTAVPVKHGQKRKK